VEGAKNAIKLNGQDFGGRKLYVDVDEGKAKGGYKARGSKSHSTKYADESVKKTIKKSKNKSSKSNIKNFQANKEMKRLENND